MNSRRPYHSPRRQEQARQTRRAILEAARPLFVERGYTGTSMGDIAQAADVSIKTVEAAFGTKAKLLTALRDVSVVGDDEAIPVAERAWFKEMLDEQDPRRQLELHAQNTSRIKRRTAALNEAIRRAAPADPEIAALWQVFQQQFMVDQRLVAESLAARGALREGLDVDAATNIIGLLNHPSVYFLAVFDHGWSEEQFEQWLVDALIRQLLP
ncbi:MAG TPA: helix-turn-helix domain-containing protein [Chloroflexota bacterium]